MREDSSSERANLHFIIAGLLAPPAGARRLCYELLNAQLN